MASTGLRNPRLNTAICLAIALGGGIAIWSGMAEMEAVGGETSGSAVKIGAGLLALIMGLALSFNFARGIAFINRIRGGKDEIARWTVSAADFDAFRENDRQRNGLGLAYINDYRVPKKTPAAGVDVHFAEDGVLVGDTYFGLVSTGMFTFEGVQMLPGSPLALEFGTAALLVSNVTTVRIRKDRGVLRIPVGRLAVADAQRVLAHFSAVQSGERIVRPDFYRGRARLGVIVALVCAVIAGAGFGLQFGGPELGLTDLGEVPLIMAVAGTICALGGLVLAVLASLLSASQHNRGRTRP